MRGARDTVEWIAKALVAALIVLAPGSVHAAAEVRVGSTDALPGETVAIQTSLLDRGESVAALSVELRFDPQRIVQEDLACAIHPRIGPSSGAAKNLQWGVPVPGLLRVGVVGINLNTISSGVLFTCDFAVSDMAPGGTVPLASSSQAADPGGASVPITASSGAIHIDDDPDGDGRLYTGLGDACTGGQSIGCEDNCPFVANANQADADGNAVGDACECGDIDGNGRVDTTDVRLLQRCGSRELTGPICSGVCDATGDGKCDTSDARVVQRLVVGELSSADLACPQRSFRP